MGDQVHLNDVLFGQFMSSSPEIQRTGTQLVLSTIEPENFTERLLQAILDGLDQVEGSLPGHSSE